MSKSYGALGEFDMGKETIEVLSVARATDGITGKDITAVQFGRIDRNVKPAFAPSGPFGTIGAPASLVLTLLFEFKDGVAPYKVGSKWVLNVSENGAFTLEEAKK